MLGVYIDSDERGYKRLLEDDKNLTRANLAISYRSLGEFTGLIPLDSTGDADEDLRSPLVELLSESLLALLIQLLNVGDKDNLSNEVAESRFFLLDLVDTPESTSDNSGLVVVARERRETDDECFGVEAVDREELCTTGAVEVLGLTPFSRRCNGHGF